MNNFTIEDDPAVSADLARLWVDVVDRAAATRADAEANRRLAADPVGYGEYKSEGIYLMVVPPLAFTYEVDPARRLVTVLSIGFVTSPSGPS